MKNYISQLNGKEQNAIHCIKKLIANQLNVLVIYCFGCETNICIKRTAFIKKQFKEERQFTCDMLIITPDAMVVDEEKRTEIQETIAHFGTVNMLIHPLGFVLRQINEGNLFFSWVHKNGMLLYNRNNCVQLLPIPVANEYRQQAEAFYANNPHMNNYLEIKFQPIVKPKLKKEATSPLPPVEIKLTLDAANG